MRRTIALTALFVISFNSCLSLRINKTINKDVPSQTENLIKDFSGKFYLTVSFGEPFGDIDANLELYYDNSTIQSVISYFDGDKYIPVKVNSTELFDGAIFINLEDQEAGDIEMEVYFDDQTSISGFYAGQLKFTGKRIN
jgi:hypothetical protein